MPRQRKPFHLKVLAGTNKSTKPPSNVILMPLVKDNLAPPDWLVDKNSLQEWHRLAPILIQNGLLNEANISAFGMGCAIFGKIINLWENGETPTGHLLAQYRALSNDFGLTPSSQTRIGESFSSKPSVFSNNGKRE